MAASASISSKSTSRSATTQTTVKPDLAYYQGKTINLYTYGSPGQAVDLEERILAPYIASYLHCTVIIHNDSGGGSLPGQNIAALAAPDGLTVGMANLVGDIADFVSNTTGLAFSIRTIPYLKMLGSLDYVEVTTPASGYKTIKSLIKSPTPIATLYAVDSTAGALTELLYGSLHIPPRYITGYPGAAQVLAGFIQGNGQAIFNAYSSVQSLVIGNQAVPLLQTQPAEKGELGYNIMHKVPVLATWAAANPPKSKSQKQELQITEDLLYLASPLFVPVGTPAKYKAALNAAIKYAATRPGAKQQLISDGLPTSIETPTDVTSRVNYIIKNQALLDKWITPGA